MLKAIRPQGEGHKGDVGGIHGLETESRTVAVEVGIFNEILDRLDNLRTGGAEVLILMLRNIIHGEYQ